MCDVDQACGLTIEGSMRLWLRALDVYEKYDRGDLGMYRQ